MMDRQHAVTLPSGAARSFVTTRDCFKLSHTTLLDMQQDEEPIADELSNSSGWSAAEEDSDTTCSILLNADLTLGLVVQNGSQLVDAPGTVTIAHDGGTKNITPIAAPESSAGFPWETNTYELTACGKYGAILVMDPREFKDEQTPMEVFQASCPKFLVAPNDIQMKLLKKICCKTKAQPQRIVAENSIAHVESPDVRKALFDAFPGRGRPSADVLEEAKTNAVAKKRKRPVKDTVVANPFSAKPGDAAAKPAKQAAVKPAAAKPSAAKRQAVNTAQPPAKAKPAPAKPPTRAPDTAVAPVAVRTEESANCAPKRRAVVDIRIECTSDEQLVALQALLGCAP